MSGDIMLDTNIVIGIAENDQIIVEKIRAFECTIFVSSIVVGELLNGLEMSHRKKQNLQNPENDIWNAATTVQFGLDLITRDHQFKQIDNLNLQYW